MSIQEQKTEDLYGRRKNLVEQLLLLQTRLARVKEERRKLAVECRRPGFRPAQGMWGRLAVEQRAVVAQIGPITHELLMIKRRLPHVSFSGCFLEVAREILDPDLFARIETLANERHAKEEAAR